MLFVGTTMAGQAVTTVCGERIHTVSFLYGPRWAEAYTVTTVSGRLFYVVVDGRDGMGVISENHSHANVFHVLETGQVTIGNPVADSLHVVVPPHFSVKVVQETYDPTKMLRVLLCDIQDKEVTANPMPMPVWFELPGWVCSVQLYKYQDRYYLLSRGPYAQRCAWMCAKDYPWSSTSYSDIGI